MNERCLRSTTFPRHLIYRDNGISHRDRLHRVNHTEKRQRRSFIKIFNKYVQHACIKYIKFTTSRAMCTRETERFQQKLDENQHTLSLPSVYRGGGFPSICRFPRYSWNGRGWKLWGNIGMDGDRRTLSYSIGCGPVFPVSRRFPRDSYRFISIPWARPLHTALWSYGEYFSEFRACTYLTKVRVIPVIYVFGGKVRSTNALHSSVEKVSRVDGKQRSSKMEPEDFNPGVERGLRPVNVRITALSRISISVTKDIPCCKYFPEATW